MKTDTSPRANKMAVMPIPQLVVSLALPLMFSLLVQSLYNIVDSIFVARLGQEALTAVSLAYPVQILMIAAAVGTSVGVNALLSKSIGAGEKRRTSSIATTGVVLALAGALVFALAGAAGAGRFAALYTQNDAIARDCAAYLRICMIFGLGSFLGTMYQRFLQAVGNAFGSMLTLLAGALLNLVLDPILIFGLPGLPGLGVRGAAVATVLGQWLSAVCAIALNTLRNPAVQPRWKGWRPEGRVIAGIYRVGLPTIITQALGSVMVSALNGILMPLSPAAVAFFGVYYKLQNFLFMPMNGLGQGVIPVVGYNYGARNPERVRCAFRVSIPLSAGIALGGTAVFLAFPAQLLALFDAGAEMLAIGVPALRIIAPTFLFAAVTTILGYGCSGLGDGTVNMLGAGLRQVVVLVPLVWLLARTAGLDAVWYAFWIAEPAALLVSAAGWLRLMRRRGMLDPAAHRSEKADSSL